MNKKKSVTIINQVFGPMSIDVANEFLKAGYNTKIITGRIEETYCSLYESIIISKGVRYRRNHYLLRILTWLLFFLLTLTKLFFSNKDRDLLIVSNPPISPLMGYVMNFLFNQKYQVVVYDIYPNLLVDLGYIKKGGLIDNIWTFFNIKCYENSDRVITLTDEMKETLCEVVESNKIDVIPCWVDTNRIKPILNKEENSFAVKNNVAKKCTVLYSGNMGLSHNLECVIDAAFELIDVSFIHFLFIGDGAKLEKLKKKAIKLNLDNITFLEFQNENVFPYSMACADIGLVSVERGASNHLIPSKTFYYLAVGALVLSISKKSSSLSNFIEKNKLGYNFDMLKDNNLSELIRKMSKEVSNNQKNNSSKVIENYDLKLAKKFIR